MLLGRLTAVAVPVPGIAELTLLGVDRDGGAHILHSILSVPVGPYDPDRIFFGCRGELFSEGLPTTNEITVASFVAQRVSSSVSREDHIVHLEVVPPYCWRTTPCKRARGKGEGKKLSCRGLTLLPPDEIAPLLHI